MNRKSQPPAIFVVAWSLLAMISVPALTAQNPSQLPPPPLYFPGEISLQTASLGQIDKAIRRELATHPLKAPDLVASTIAVLHDHGRIVTQTLPATVREAKILRILVKQGQKVDTGRVIAIISSGGRVDTQLNSSAEGTMELINVAQGSTLRKGEPFGVIRLSAPGVESAVQTVIVAAAASAPNMIAEIVTRSCRASPDFGPIIAATAKDACPDQTASIDKALASMSPAAASVSSPPRSASATSPSASPSQDPHNSARREISLAMDDLRKSGRISDPAQVSETVTREIRKHTVTSAVSAPSGARIIAIHKKPGEIVQPGDILITLKMPDGRKIPILAKQRGVMMEVAVSKGGYIGNSVPKNAFQRVPGRQPCILITLYTP